MGQFKVVSDYTPSGDQPQAIDTLASGIENGLRDQVLLGVTGSGKTYTMAKVIERVQRPTLVLAHNKPWQPSCVRSSGPSSRKTPWNTSCLLRLLPAGGVHPPHGYLHREGRRHQRRDRAPAPQRHRRPV